MRNDGASVRRRAVTRLLATAAGAFCLLTLAGCAAAAQTAPPPLLTAVSPNRIALGSLVTLTVDNLREKVAQDKYDPGELRLVLDDHVLQDLKPEVDLTAGTVGFRLVRTDADKAAWADLLGAPPIGGERRVSIGLFLDATHRVARGPHFPPRITLLIFTWPWLGAGIAGLFLAVAGFILLAQKSDILRDYRPTQAQLLPGQRRPYSLARCQMAFWFFLVLAAFLLIWLITGDYNGIVTEQTLVLVGISASTGAFSAAIDSNKSATAPPTSPHTTFFDDLLTDVNGIALHRYQMLAWTIALGIIFVYSTYRTLATPNFDANLLTLLGISSGTYLGFKFPERQP
ncbi:MAG TPA: hypothetical protein VM755_09135 [Stellaceae bacterium]|nr:hypothetical protein [Stellaceae bacterium]